MPFVFMRYRERRRKLRMALGRPARGNPAAQQTGPSKLRSLPRAGEALLKAKAMVRHGEFKSWIEANCRCSYRQAGKYTTVAKIASRGEFDPNSGIDAFLEAHATSRKSSADPDGGISGTICPFTPDDAEHALKLARMANSGNENEAAVAQTKLDRFAEGFGMTGEEAQAKAATSRVFAVLRVLGNQGRRRDWPDICPRAGALLSLEWVPIAGNHPKYLLVLRFSDFRHVGAIGRASIAPEAPVPRPVPAPVRGPSLSAE